MQTEKKDLKELARSLPTTSEALEKFWDIKSRQVYLLRYALVQKTLSELLKGKEHCVILDAGCGDGTLLDFFHRISESIIYVGVDFSSKGIQHAFLKWRKFKAVTEAYFILADVENLPFQRKSVDVLISIEVLEHLLDPKLAILEMNRVLKYNGKCILTTPSAFKLSRSLYSVIKNSLLAQVDKPPKKREALLRTKVGIVIPHKDFTRFELKVLLNAVFQITNVTSMTFNRIYVILKTVLPANATGKLFYVDLVMSRLPFVKVLGDHWLVIGEKSSTKTT